MVYGGFFMDFFKLNYEKECTVICKDSPNKTGFKLFLDILFREFWNLIKVNLLFILFSIPIITIPAAYGALSSVTMSMVKEKLSYIFSDFKDAFICNWRQCSINGIIFLILSIILTTSIIFYSEGSINIKLLYVPFFISIFFSIITFFAFIYIFPMIISVDLSTKNIIKNGYFLSIISLKNTFIAAILKLFVLSVSILLLPFTLILLFTLTFSLLSFINCFYAWPSIQRYVIKNENNQGQ